MKGLSLSVDEEDVAETPSVDKKLSFDLSLEVEDEEANLAKSYNISNGGTFAMAGFHINKNGLKPKSLLEAASIAHHAANQNPKLNLGTSLLPGNFNGTLGPRGSALQVQSKPSPQSSNAFQVDDLVSLRTLGRGASGIVYLTMHVPTLTLVAQKQISIFDQSTRQQFVKEISAYSSALTNAPSSTPATASNMSLEKSLANINANIYASQLSNNPKSNNARSKNSSGSLLNDLISFYGAGYSDGKISLLLEYMDRGSLQDYIESFGVMKENVLRVVYRQATQGLSTLHSRHQVHRDIKPGNILVNHRGEVKLADFGILAILNDKDGSDQLCKTFCGTTLYMSPERVRGDSYSYPGDIWSLGLSIIVSAIGHFPYEAKHGYFGIVAKVLDEPSPTLPESFGKEIRDFVAKCLIKDPKERWTAEQLLSHPFLTTSDSINSVEDKWPPHTVNEKRAALDNEDVLRILEAVVDHYYIKTKAVYRASLFDMARLERVAEQFDMETSEVVPKFESLYKRMVPQVNSVAVSQISTPTKSTVATLSNTAAVMKSPSNPSATSVATLNHNVVPTLNHNASKQVSMHNSSSANIFVASKVPQSLGSTISKVNVSTSAISTLGNPSKLMAKHPSNVNSTIVKLAPNPSVVSINAAKPAPK